MLGVGTQAKTLGSVGFFPVVGSRLSKQLGAGLLKMNTAVVKTQRADDALKSLLPVGLGTEGGNFSKIYTDTFVRIVVRGEDPQKVVNDRGRSCRRSWTRPPLRAGHPTREPRATVQGEVRA